MLLQIPIIPYEVVTLLAILFTIIGAVWTLAWWLSAKFSSQSQKFSDKLDRMMSEIMTKLDYHEKHDDQRFLDVNNNLWAIRIRNAARDGIEMKAVAETKPKNV